MKAEKRKAFFHPKSFIESKNIGARTRIWAFTHVMKHASIGEDCNIGEHCFIENCAVIGNRVTVKNGVCLWEGVTLEEDVFVGPNAVFTNDSFPVSRRQPAYFEKIHVKKGACIGANATILCGVTVGRYAFIGAGSVVTSNVPDHALVYGNPSKFKGFLCACRRKLKWFGRKAHCRCELRYRKISGKVQPT